MDSNTFMGLLIAALVVLVGLASGLAALIIKPVINLNKTITKLDCTIKTLVDDNSETKHHFDKNDKKIDDLEKTTMYHEGELKIHDTRIKALEKRG